MATVPTNQELKDQIKRLQAENKSLKNELNAQYETLEFYNTLMSNMQTGILIEDKNRKVKAVNQKFCNLFNVPDKQGVIGVDCNMALHKYAELFCEPDKLIAYINTLIEGGDVAFHLRLKLKDGRYFELGHIPVNYKNKLLGTFWSIEDVTGQKVSEERFAKAFMVSPVIAGLSTLDTGKYVEVNQTFFEKTGYTKDEVIGKKVIDLIDFEPGFRDKTLKQLKKKGNVRNLETIIRTKNGGIFNVLLSADIINIQGKDYNFTTVIDITDRKKTEELLQHRESFLNTLFKAIPHIIWLKDSNGVFLSCNPRFEDLFGKKEADIVGKTDYDFFDKELADFFRKKDKAALAEGGPTTNEETVTFACDGHTELLETVKTPMFDVNGKLLGVLGVAHDITGRKKIEEELIDQKQRLNDIIDGTNVGTWEWNVQTGETIFNERWANIIGYTLDEIGPVSIETWAKYAHPGDLKKSGGLLQRHFNGELEYYEFECRMKHKNGTWVWVFDRGKVTKWDEKGEPLWMYGTHQEITDRKKTEIALKESKELFTAFMDYLPAIVFIKDDELRTLFTNKYMKDKLGSGDSWIDKTTIEIFGDTELAWSMMKDDMNTLKTGFKKQEEEVPTKDGTIQHFETRKFRIDRENNTPLLGGIALNISDRKRYEKELIDAKQKAEESDKLKSAFLANLSHEIRTPMNAIIGFSQFLKDRKKTREEIDNYADIISNSGKHLLSLINDIIDVSKIDAGQMSVYFEEINLNLVLKELYSFFHSQLISKSNYDTQLFIDIPGGDMYIKTDETRLRQILINLIGNAIKFTQKGFVEFGYYIKEKELLFYVKDTGIGIPEEMQEHIFKRFRQANESTERVYKGTGLGLSIAKACTQLLHGEIWYKSYVGKGTTFFFTIELNRCKAPEKQIIISDTDEISFNGEHILIAEDDDLNFQYLQEIFKTHNVHITRTITGKETYEAIIANKDIKLVLMDIQLPLGNGWKVTGKIREKGLKIPIIAHTAYAFETDKQKSLDTGCDDYISKPAEPNKLLELVYKYLYR